MAERCACAMRLDHVRYATRVGNNIKCNILYYFLLLALRIYHQSFLSLIMKATAVVLLLAFAIIVASAQTNYCPEPKVKDKVIPKQHFYKHGQSIRVGHPHKYFLRCMNGEWKKSISSPILPAHHSCFL